MKSIRSHVPASDSLSNKANPPEDMASPKVIIEKLANFIVRALVDQPQHVNINALVTSSSIIIEVMTAPEDIGKVIGKGGQTAKAIRKIMSAVATKFNMKSLFQIIEPRPALKTGTHN